MTDSTAITEKSLKRSRVAYIFQAALEYLIALLFTGSFLAKITSELGFSDSLTGILSSIVSLGCLFQLLSLGIRKRRVKSFVIVMSILNQLIFMCLYIIPITPLSSAAKTWIFIIFIIGAYLIYNMAHAKKISWLMSLVEDRRRGLFTANKEIVSLIAGMIFTFVMGNIIDRFSESNNIRGAFILSAIVVFVLMIVHTVSMAVTVEKETPERPKVSVSASIRDLIKNKKLRGVAITFIIYYIAHSLTVPFYGAYQINTLGFSLGFVSILSIAGSVLRIFISRFMGRYADKTSFGHMLEKCFIFLALGFACVVFAVPSNGKVMMAGYSVFSSLASAGISSALVNLVFDYAEPEKRSDALAICQATSGVIGFFATLAISPFVSMIQTNGNRFLGMNIYAQQAVSVLGVIFILLAAIYIRVVLIRKKK